MIRGESLVVRVDQREAGGDHLEPAVVLQQGQTAREAFFVVEVVRVEDGDDVTVLRGHADEAVDGGVGSLILLAEHFDAVAAEGAAYGQGFVAGSVIDADDAVGPSRLGEYGFQRFADIGGVVVDRDDDGEPHDGLGLGLDRAGWPDSGGRGKGKPPPGRPDGG